VQTTPQKKRADLHHVNKSVDYVAIDLTGATKSQSDEIYNYVSTLTKE